MLTTTSLLMLALLGTINIEPGTWCLKPRDPEPLLAEGIGLGTSIDGPGKGMRDLLKIAPAPRESIKVVRDESTCRLAAAAYWGFLRKTVAELFADSPDSPVLVVVVGDVFLVDDLRSRNEDDYWEVIIFDRKWRRLYSYGGGA